MYRTITQVIAIVILILIGSMFFIPVVSDDKFSYGISIDVDMVRRYKILPGDDKPYCVAEKGRYIYVTGIGNNGAVAYIFKIDKDRGYVQKVWNTAREGCEIEFHDCMFIGDYLYIIGIGCANRGDTTWMYLVFNETLALLLKVEENPTSKEDWVHALTSDGEYIYAVGGINGTGGYKAVMVWQWRVEKRKLDLSPISSYTSKNIYGGRPFDIEINPVTNHIWIVGTNRKPYERVFMWSILILDKNLRLVKEFTLEELRGQALTVCFDNRGYAYIGGDDAVIKMDNDGDIMKVQEYRNITFSKSMCLDDYVFMVGDILRPNKTRHQIAVLMDTDLNIVSMKVLHDPTNATSSYFDIGSLAFDGSYIYVAGHEETIRYNNLFEWTVYKLSLRRNGEIITAPPKIINPVSPIFTPSQETHTIPLYTVLVITTVVLIASYVIFRYRVHRKKYPKLSGKRLGRRVANIR